MGQHGLNGAGLIVVEQTDGVVYHQHWGEFTPDRVSFIASSSKMVAAGVLMRLHEQGLLDIDAPVADVVPWGSGNPTVTPVQLMSSSSGLVALQGGSQASVAYQPYLCQFLPTGTLQACGGQIFTTPDDDADVVQPDTEYRYGGAQWQVVGAVAEAASGKSWAELVDEVYVRPCGLDVLGFNNHFADPGALLTLLLGGLPYPRVLGDPRALADTANPNIEGGGYTTTGDYGNLLLMHLRGGLCGENRVLSTESLVRMQSDRIGPTYGGSTDDGQGYGMGWFVNRAAGRITDGGLYGTQPWLVPSEGYGAYLVLEASNTHGNALAGQLYGMVDVAVREGRR